MAPSCKPQDSCAIAPAVAPVQGWPLKFPQPPAMAPVQRKDVEDLELPKRRTDVRERSLGDVVQRSGTTLGRTRTCCSFLYPRVLHCVSAEFVCLQVEAISSGPATWTGASVSILFRAIEWLWSLCRDRAGDLWQVLTPTTQGLERWLSRCEHWLLFQD